MMMQNPMNNQNQNDFYINPNQKFLVDKIIKFYRGSYMNYSEPNQIRQLLNNLDTNSPLLKEGNDITDPFPYIHEEKKLIRFINHDFKIFNVKVPITFDKKILYDVANIYKSIYFSRILLIYKNTILIEDEGSIDSISQGDFIVIIEDIYYLDHSYFNKFKYSDYIGEKKNVLLQIRDNNQNLVVPSNTKLFQIYKALILHFGSDYRFLYYAKNINEKDDRIIDNQSRIECIKTGDLKTGYGIKFGKKINLKIDIKDSKGKKIIKNGSLVLEIGIFDSVKHFIEYIECQNYIKVRSFSLKGKIINLEEDRSFASLGIKEDCEGQVITY